MDGTERLSELEQRVEALEKRMELASSALCTSPEALGLDIELNVTNRQMFDSLSLEGDLELRFSDWHFEWGCNIFNSCITGYHGTVFVIRRSTGRTERWNLIESATRKDHGLPYWSTTPHYQFQKGSERVSFGWPGREEGRSQHVSTCINCYADWGSVSFRWDATA